MFGQSSSAVNEVNSSEAQADINIFTVASGLLYEVRAICFWTLFFKVLMLTALS
jgi:hypothetical protein